MRQETVRVVTCGEINPGTFELTLEAPWLAAARPGQFVHLRVGETNDPLLRRPLSIFRVRPAGQWGAGQAFHSGAPVPPSLKGGQDLSFPGDDRAWGQVSLLFRVVGRGTAWLAARKPGDAVDVIGPLGRPFTIAPSSRHLLLVAGGVGVAPLVMLADEAVARGISVTLAMGAKSEAEVFPGQRLPPEVEYLVATEDGSLGHRGFVTEALDEVYDWADQVFACGPLGMLAALKRVSRRRPATPVQVSLEEHMGCAVGVCYGCVVNTRHGPQRVCADGPVFDLDEVELP